MIAFAIFAEAYLPSQASTTGQDQCTERLPVYSLRCLSRIIIAATHGGQRQLTKSGINTPITAPPFPKPSLSGRRGLAILIPQNQ